MAVRKATEQDYEGLANLYKSFFKEHNVFHQDAGKIALYLKGEAKKNELLAYDEKGSIKGAVFIVREGQTPDGLHKRWKFRHFAFGSEKAASALLEEAEKAVKKSSKTAKIELTVAETEKGIEFYRSKGYEQEGVLKNHYRWGESCFVLSKSFQNKKL